MLQKQVVTVPLSGGIDTKSDDKTVEPGKSLVLENWRMYKNGKIQKRSGQENLTNSSSDGSFSSSDKRYLLCDDDYLSAMTSSGVYAYSQGDAQWFKQSQFSLSSKIETQFVSKCQFNQRWPDFDMTSDGSHMVFSCAQDSVSTPFNSSILIVIQDMATGLKKTATINLVVTTRIKGGRVVVEKSGGSVYVHAFYVDSGVLKRSIFDENLSAISSGVTILASSPKEAQFDICKDDSAIYLAHLLGTSLELRSYNFEGVQQDTNSVTVTNGLAITKNIINPIGPVYNDLGKSVSICTTSSHLHVAWLDGYIKGFTKDLVASIAETSFTAQLTKLAICSNGESIVIASDSESSSSTISGFYYSTATFTASYLVTAPEEVERLALASAPFVVSGKNMILARCNEEYNRNFYVFNLTDWYIAQSFSRSLATQQTVDGHAPDMMTPKVVVQDGVARTCIPRFAILSGSDKSDQISGISLTEHDFNVTKNGGSKLMVGQSVYHVDGHLLEFDKLYAFENSFLFIPEIRGVNEVNTGGSANPGIASKTFKYIAAYEYYSASGERTISAFSPISEITTTAAARYVTLEVSTPVLSLKNRLTINNFNQPLSIVIYRTTNGGTIFYRDAAFITSFNNGFTTVISDSSSDSSISDNEQAYTTGGVLENDPPPTARFGVAGGGRIFLGGLEESDEIAYSKKQLFGEAVLFSDFFRMRVSTGSCADRTNISAVGYMDGKLIIFREGSIYYVQGDGPNELGVGDTFTEPEVISSDTGCSDPRSVLNTPFGIMFKSKKGIYMLDRALQVSYIGAAVEDFNGEDIVSALIHEKYNEARFYTSDGKCLVFNFDINEWSVFTNQTSIDADTWSGLPIMIKGSGASREVESVYLDGSTVITGRIKTPWLKLTGLQDYSRIWSATILGKYKSAHKLNVKVYYDYETGYVEEYEISPQPTDKQYQYRIHLKKQKCESVQFEIQDTDQVGESMELTAITLEVGLKKGSYKINPGRKY